MNLKRNYTAPTIEDDDELDEETILKRLTTASAGAQMTTGGNRFSSALGGATAGASLGSFGGPIGAGIGAVVGGIGGAIFGGERKDKDMEKLTKDNLRLQNKAMVQDYIKKQRKEQWSVEFRNKMLGY